MHDANSTPHLNHWIPRFVVLGDSTHRVRARLRKPGPVPRPAPGAATGDVGRVLRLLRKHSPVDPRIRRDRSDAKRSATPIRTADESPFAAGSTPGRADRTGM